MVGVDSHLIRRRTEDDLPALVDGLRLAAAADGYPSVWPGDPAGWLRGDDLIGAWVAERDGTPVGQVVLRRTDGSADPPVRMWCDATGGAATECAVVNRLFVIPSAQRGGAGAALMAAACAAAAGQGLHAVLDVVDTNRAAVRLYERLGWLRLGSVEVTFRGARAPELLLCFVAP